MKYEEPRRFKKWEPKHWIETPMGQFVPDIRYTDNPEHEKLLEKPIGKYGDLWQKWIDTVHPNHKILYVIGCTWQIIPRQIDVKAEQRTAELEEIYEHDNPRPDTLDFMTLLRWEEAKKLWVENIIIEELVNVEYPTGFGDGTTNALTDDDIE